MKQQSSLAELSIMHPTIDDYSKTLLDEKRADRKDKPTYERLYELNKERQAKHA